MSSPGDQTRGEVEVGGESITYTLCEFDRRSEAQRQENAKNLRPDGNLNVYLPGHGQPPDAARNLLATIVALSRSKVLWSITIDAARAGDAARAEALTKVVGERVRQEFLPGSDLSPEEAPLPGATLFGWSHGALVALLAAEANSRLFPQVVCFCPAGLVKRPPLELALSYWLGSAVSFWRALFRFDGTAERLLERGRNVRASAARDLARSRSSRTAMGGVQWASRKVVGESYEYDGQVVILFGEDDAVVRWRDVFPRCEDPGCVTRCVDEYRRNNFPKVRVLRVRVLDGDHAAPELRAELYVRAALDLLEV